MSVCALAALGGIVYSYKTLVTFVWKHYAASTGGSRNVFIYGTLKHNGFIFSLGPRFLSVFGVQTNEFRIRVYVLPVNIYGNINSMNAYKRGALIQTGSRA